VVVPNWNGAAYLGLTLDSLRAQLRPADDVIVVDNGSTDGSRQLLAERYPDVQVVALQRNTGFAGAANAGIRAARGDLVAVLNNDARPRPDWLARLVAQPDDPRVWAWGSVLVSPDGTVESAGDHYDPKGYAYKMAVGGRLTDLPAEPYEVFAPPGASPLMRRDVLMQLGGYEERFFLYYEDVDLSFRALLAGFTAVVVPDAVVEHDLGRSSAGSARPWFYIGRNSLWCALRCQPRIHPRSLVRRTRRELTTARSRTPGAAAAYMRGRAVGALLLPWALWTRRAIQRSRVIDDARVSAVLAAPPLPRRITAS